MSELRITDTNSVNDSKGRAFGLEGNDFIYVLVAFVVGFGLYLLLTVAFHAGMLAALCLTAPILGLTVAWVVLLRRNRPEGFAEDWFDHLVNREGWSFAPGAQPIPAGDSDHEKRRT
jgi:hypothetical protein